MRLTFLCRVLLMLTFLSASVSFAEIDWCKQYAIEKDFDKSIEACTKQIDGDVAVRHLEYSYSNRGAAYANKKQYDEAISDYSRAINLDPRYTTAYYNRAIAYLGLTQYDKAILDFSKVIELRPDDSAAFVGRATAYVNNEQFDKAISDLTRAIELDPDNSVAYHNRAAVYESRKQFVQAATDRRKAAELTSHASSAATAKASPSARKTYCVQLGVFKNKKNATDLAGRFREKGYDTSVTKGHKGKVVFYRVLAGKVDDRSQAEKLAARIREREKTAPIVIFE